MMWNETSCRQLIATHYEWFLEQWDEYKLPIQHADVCRYFILHRHGGLYADLDIRPLRSISPFLEEVAREGKEVRLLEKERQSFVGETLCIGMMASIPRAPFWDAVFTALQHRRHRWFYQFSPHIRVIMSTGPQVVMRVVRAQRHKVGLFPARHFYACDACATLPCQQEEGWVAFEEGGLSWNQWDTMVLNTLDCYVNHPFQCLLQKYTIILMPLSYCMVIPAVLGLSRLAKFMRRRFLPAWQQGVASARRIWVCAASKKNACRPCFERLLKTMLATLVLFVLYTSLMAHWSTSSLSKCRPHLCSGQQRVLLVTAHPDDESMFFLPTIQQCRERQNEVHLLCLSNGNADGLGLTRAQELEDVASFLGIALKVVNDSALQDGMSRDWDSFVIRQYVQSYIQEHNITRVVTFDVDGVSQHPNHLSLHSAMVELHRSYHRKGTQFFQLDTVGLFRKFAGMLDLPLSIYDSIDGELFLGSLGASWHAMQLHESQFVWFRRLFVLFSRYTYVNTLRNFNTVLYPNGGQCARRKDRP